jgi:hypothetical protein
VHIRGDVFLNASARYAVPAAAPRSLNATDRPPARQRLLPTPPAPVVDVVDVPGTLAEIDAFVDDVVAATVLATVGPGVVGVANRRALWLQPSVSAANRTAAGRKGLTAPAWHGGHAKMGYVLR